MKLAITILTALLLTVPAVRANAEPVDCEAARCTIQATIDAECPCAEAKNHGRYTSCVGKVVNRLVREKAIPKKCRSKIEGCAIRSTCGKRDGTVACQLPGSSVTSRCRPLSSESACTSRGGTVVASCCATCSGPIPTVTPTAVETSTPGPVETETPGPVETETPGPGETETPAPTATESAVPTETPGPVETETPGPVATETAGPVATETAGPVATETPGPVATETPGPVATETAGPVATETPGPVATETTGPVATETPGPVATETVVAATATPVATATQTATVVPTTTATGTVVPTTTASVTATPVPVTPTPVLTPGVGNGVVDPGEDCDPAGGTATSCQAASNTSAAFICNGATAQCGCPTKVTFTGDPTHPLSVLDTGWTGIAHRSPIISNGDVTVVLSNCTGTSRPCGTCTVTGPIPNPNAGAGQLDNQRCTNDQSRRCTNDATCTPRNCLGGSNHNAACTTDSQCPGGTCPAAGTCQFFFGAPLPLAAGGVSTCVNNQFNGPISGTANVESGEAANKAALLSRVFLAATIDEPCSRCLNDGAINDGIQGGTCDSGPRQNRSCDANGSVPSRPDFGTTSLDCPSSAGSQIALLSIDLSNATDSVIRTLSVDSPNCLGSAGDKCMCGTCNNGLNQSCFTNADCTDPPGPIGPICNGQRCLGGVNAGAACTGAASQCPGSSCSRPGESAKPSGCSDDTTIANRVMECADGDGDGEGECTVSPIDQNCTVASGHAQRGCMNDDDCGGTSNSCGSFNRACFLTGGGTFQPAGKNDGSDSLIAAGMEDLPMNDVSNPTLGAVFCVAPTQAGAVNGVAGLPGPARVTIRGTAVGLP